MLSCAVAEDSVRLVVFLGAPGSGKGTQAKRLAISNPKIVHFSTGDSLREAIKKATLLGIEAKAYVERGQLVPDGTMIRLIESELEALKQVDTVVLDGFPRTVAQAEALEQSPTTRVTKVYYFKLSHSILVERLSGRRLCSNCSEPYHVQFFPPKVAGQCDKCGGKLIQRNDDKGDVIETRLAVYESQTATLLEYYGQSNRLITIDASRTPETIHDELARWLM